MEILAISFTPPLGTEKANSTQYAKLNVYRKTWSILHIIQMPHINPSMMKNTISSTETTLDTHCSLLLNADRTPSMHYFETQSQRLTEKHYKTYLSCIILVVIIHTLSLCGKGSLPKMSLHKMKQQPSLKTLTFIVKAWKEELVAVAEV